MEYTLLFILTVFRSQTDIFLLPLLSPPITWRPGKGLISYPNGVPLDPASWFHPWYLTGVWPEKLRFKSLCYWVEKEGLKSILGYVKGCQIWPALLASCWLQGKGCSWRLTVKTMKLWGQTELLITPCPAHSNHFPSDSTNWPGLWLSFRGGATASSPHWLHTRAFNFLGLIQHRPRRLSPLGPCPSLDRKADIDDEVCVYWAGGGVGWGDEGHLTMRVWGKALQKCHLLAVAVTTWNRSQVAGCGRVKPSEVWKEKIY